MKGLSVPASSGKDEKVVNPSINYKQLAIQGALFRAIEAGNIGGVQKALAEGANPNAPSILDGATPLLSAIYHEKPDAVEIITILVKTGANPNQEGLLEGKETTPVMRAVYQKKVEFIEALNIQSTLKIDITSKTPDFEGTPIDRAKYQKDEVIVCKLNDILIERLSISTSSGLDLSQSHEDSLSTISGRESQMLAGELPDTAL